MKKKEDNEIVLRVNNMIYIFNETHPVQRCSPHIIACYRYNS